MSPTLSDDLLVRDLHERVERALPPMSLDLADVLVVGRRHRRRRTVALSAAGALAVGAFVVGATQIWAGEPDPTLPAGVEQAPRPLGDGQTVELAPGVIAANRPVQVTLDDGTPVLDLGLTGAGLVDSRQDLVLAVATDAELADLATLYSTSRYDSGVVVAGISDGAVEPLRWQDSSGADPVARGWMVAWRQPTARDVGRPLGDVDASTAGMSYGDDGSQVRAGAVPPWLPDPRVVVFSNQGYTTADGSTVRALELPTFTGPTDDHRLLYAMRVDASQGFVAGSEADGSTFIADALDVVLFLGSDGEKVLGGQCAGQTFNECSATFTQLSEAVDLVLANDPQTADDAGDTLSIRVAQDVAAAGSSAGPVVDLGVPVRNDYARVLADGTREELTYAILLTTVGEMAAEAEVSLTPEEAAGDALLLAGLKPFGALIPMSGSDLATARAAKDAGPILQARASTHDIDALGMLPAGSRAAVVLVVERASGTERVPVPTFRVPGVDEDFFFVALHDDAVDLADWPSVYVEVTDQDGTVTLRSLPGVQAVAVSPSPTDDPVASDSG